MSERPYDLLIRGGSVIDGTGGPARRADVAVRDGRIASVAANVKGAAARVIEAEGLVVGPGFIDVHSHDDAAVIANPGVDFKVMQGVTTEIVGNCGVGLAPAGEVFQTFLQAGLSNGVGSVPEVTWRTFGEYMDAVEEARPALNVACLAPHGVIRFGTLGLESRPPAGAEPAATPQHFIYTIQ